MNKIGKYLWILSVSAAITACDKEQPVNVEPEPVPEPSLTVPYPQTPDALGSFYALFEETARTKVVLDAADSLSWEEGDAVAVWDGEAVSEYVAAESGRSTVISGADADLEKEYYAVWPSDMPFRFSGKKLTVCLPEEQMLSAGTLPYVPSVAYSTGADRDFRFRSICGILGFTITRDDIIRLSINGLDNEIVAGTVVVNLSDMTAPTWTAVEGEGVREIVVQNVDRTPLAPGHYYVPVLAQTFESGLVISMFNSADEQAERVRSKSFTIGRGGYYDAGNVDALEDWGYSYHISTLDEFLTFMNKDSHDAMTDIKLLTDIDLSGLEVGSIRKFDGKFDGNGHRITNWKMTGPFIRTLNGTLSGLTLDQSCTMGQIPADEDFAPIVCINNGLVSDCHNHVDLYCYGTSFRTARSVGGVVAVTSGRVEECVNYGDIYLSPVNVDNATSNASEGAKQYVGGVIGKVNSLSEPVEVVLCANHGDITYTTAGYIKSQTFIGGVVGGSIATICSSTDSWQPYANVLLRCTNTGDVNFGYNTPVVIGGNNTNSAHVGGVTGYWEGDVTSAVNSGDIDVLGGRDDETGGEFLRGLTLGGVTGVVSGNITSSSNSGKITYSGTTAGAPNTIVACGQTGNISIGGVAALSGNGLTTRMTDCHNSGEMNLDMHMKPTNGTKAAVGGVCSIAYSALENCTNSAEIRIENKHKYIYVGGVVGDATLFTVTSCRNTAGLTLDQSTPAGSNHSCEAHFGGICGYSNKYIYYCDNSGDIILRNGQATGYYYRVGGILGTAGGGTYHYGRKDQYMENTGDILVDTPANVRVGGIEGTGSGGRLWYTRNSGNINVTGGNTWVYAGGLRGYCTGQIQSSENLGNVTVSTTAPKGYMAGATGYMGATQIMNTVSTGDLTYNYTGTEPAPEIYAAFCVGYISPGCQFTGSYGGNIIVNGVTSQDNLWCHALIGRIFKDEGQDIKELQVGKVARPLGFKAGSMVNGVEITADNYDDKKLLIGGEWTVDYTLIDESYGNMDYVFSVVLE